jgi:hypothetical protein
MSVSPGCGGIGGSSSLTPSARGTVAARWVLTKRFGRAVAKVDVDHANEPEDI